MDRVLVLALVLDTAVALIDAVTPVVLINLVVFGPLVAAARTGPRQTAVVGAYSVALAVYEGIPHGIFGTPDHLSRCAAIVVTSALAVWGSMLRARRETAQHRTALLAEAGIVLSASLDEESTLRSVARLAVPQFADWCAIDVLGADGRIRNVATTHVDSARVRMADELRRRYPTSADDRHGVAEVMRSGRGQLHHSISDDLLLATAVDDEQLEVLRSVGMRSAIVVPMTARGSVVGAITLVTAESGRRFDAEDLALGEELARRCALAVENAKLYRERGRLAHTLQHSLLPPRIPEVPGWEVAARFHAAGADIEAGGDFFDVFAPTGGGWAAMIGDVAGKGPEAAVVTALVRHTARAAATQDSRPSDVLLALNDALLGQQTPDGRFCTVAYARLSSDGRDRGVELASAGHPLPLRVRRDGTVAPVGEYGMLLGVSPTPPLIDTHIALDPGDKLVFFTDGVIETRTAHGMLGVEGVADALHGCGDLDTVATCERIERAVTEACPTPADDVAILVLRVAGGDGLPRGHQGLVRSGAGGRHRALSLNLRGGPDAPAEARAMFDDLDEGSVDRKDAERARLLISELVTNSVRHGQATDGDWVGFDVEIAPDEIRVDIKDRGPGFRPAAILAAPDELAGRGLYLLTELADRWGTGDAGRHMWFELDRQA